jgi:uncharacterized protein (DUF983 family)
MCAEKRHNNPGLLWSVFSNSCPRCREGKLFTNKNPYDLKTTMKMPEHCPVCRQPYELQTGFYFGTGFVSYGVSVALLGIIFVTWALAFGFSYKDNSVFWCLGVATALLLIIQPLIQRLARSIWIAFFVRYDAKAWKGGGTPISTH